MMSAPPTIPDHTLRRPIGRGAYGEVWLARNVMGAPRAVKIIWRRQFESDRPYEREFAGIQRYEPVSRTADGLVHVLHVGRNNAEGYFYYVMELADSADPMTDDHLESDPNSPSNRGRDPDVTPTVIYTPRTLRSDLKRMGRLPIADCLRVALDVVGGLTRLHDRGLLHRDVKPGNIIFVDGRAKLADIGLVATEGEGRTFVGTEGYIPPEGPGSPAADIYALGMVLYEGATGFHPEKFPKVPPEWFAEDADPELLEFHEVVLKACEGAKERRYRSAQQMHADLALLQSGQSVRHLRALEQRVTRWRRAGWVAAMIVGLAVGTSLVAHWRAKIAAETQAKETKLLEQAQQSLVRAESAEKESRQQLNAALFEQARALVLSKELGHRTRALDALKRAGGSTNLAELRRIAFAALGVPDLRLDTEAKLPWSPTLVQTDPTMSRIAIGRGAGPVTIFSLPDLRAVATLPASTNRDAYMGYWTADGRYLAVKRQMDDAGVRAYWEVWDVGRTQLVMSVGPTVAHGSLTFHPKKASFLAGHGGGLIAEWDLETKRQTRTFHLPATAHALVYSPNGRLVAAAYRAGSRWVLAFHDSSTFEVVRTVEWPESIEILTWHPGGRWVSTCAANASPWARGVRLIEPETGRITTLGEHKIKTSSAEFSGDGNYLITGGWDREVICWDLRTFQRAFTYAGTGYRHTWSADGRRCAIALPNNVLQLYAFELPRSHSLYGNPGEGLLTGQFSPDGRWLVSRDDQQLSIWNLTTNAPAILIPVPRIVSAFFSPDSSELVAVPAEYSQRGYLGRWQLNFGSNDIASSHVEALPVQFPKGMTWAACVSNDSMVMSSPDELRFTSRTNLFGGTVRPLPDLAWRGCVSPDGKYAAMLFHYSPMVSVYRLPELDEVARLPGSNVVGFVTFSPDSKEVLVLTRSGVEWYDTDAWKCTRRLLGAPVSGSYAFYTPDGRGIWMVTHFRNAALLNRETLEPILPLPNDVLPLALSPDGNQLAVSVESRWAQLWDMRKLRADLATLGLDW